MADRNNILDKLNGLESRYEEISTLITDPNVIANQDRFIKLTKEYKELGDIMDARKRYLSCMNSIKEAKDLLANESDAEIKELAREELSINENLLPQIESEIKQALVPKDPEDGKNIQMEIRAAQAGTRQPCSQEIYLICIRSSAILKNGIYLSLVSVKGL